MGRTSRLIEMGGCQTLSALAAGLRLTARSSSALQSSSTSLSGSSLASSSSPSCLRPPRRLLSPPRRRPRPLPSLRLGRRLQGRAPGRRRRRYSMTRRRGRRW
eukprot:2762894-Pyramimonas_sp.AAC.1